MNLNVIMWSIMKKVFRIGKYILLYVRNTILQ